MSYQKATVQTTLNDIKEDKTASGFDDLLITKRMAEAWPQVLIDHFSNDNSAKAQRLLVLHSLFIDKRAQEGGVQSASTKDYTQTNFDWTQGNDPYIVEYRRIAKKFGRGGWRIGFY